MIATIRCDGKVMAIKEAKEIVEVKIEMNYKAVEVVADKNGKVGLYEGKKSSIPSTRLWDGNVESEMIKRRLEKEKR